ncbi:MAG: GNAT family N-acetyltransferase [Deltaproteobacteria bacterium]|nr:GNAT family N-acetyltransferase [Deltaproteobacteria bacterium]MBW2051976.1 GNAT family N-acetyltransferase [Deltaproteobacteria bacterium]MBW2141069.1 GNAT family N-acetyltransferase [Deltaproteobacteria bacterium]MBW2323117.1 GNAT family N-acetyltransferase [Deltaproteobacteria bacterium]
MNEGDSKVLVCLEKDRVMAYALARIQKYPPASRIETYSHILDVAVKSDHRRKGVGELMLFKSVEWFDSRKINRTELNVAARNQIGYSF